MKPKKTSPSNPLLSTAGDLKSQDGDKWLHADQRYKAHGRLSV